MEVDYDFFDVNPNEEDQEEMTEEDLKKRF